MRQARSSFVSSPSNFDVTAHRYASTSRDHQFLLQVLQTNNARTMILTHHRHGRTSLCIMNILISGLLIFSFLLSSILQNGHKLLYRSLTVYPCSFSTDTSGPRLMLPRRPLDPMLRHESLLQPTSVAHYFWLSAASIYPLPNRTVKFPKPLNIQAMS